jgi:hypothetical protein
MRKYRPFRDDVQTGKIDPLLPFWVDPMNGRDAREAAFR